LRATGREVNEFTDAAAIPAMLGDGSGAAGMSDEGAASI
jgi:hypothetical protein